MARWAGGWTTDVEVSRDPVGVRRRVCGSHQGSVVTTSWCTHATTGIVQGADAGAHSHQHFRDGAETVVLAQGSRSKVSAVAGRQGSAATR